MDYSEKIITIEKALGFVKSNDHIVMGMAGSDAGDFMKNLHTIAERVQNVLITNCLPTAKSEIYDSKYRNSFHIEGMFFAGEMQKLYNNENVYYIPSHLHLMSATRLYYRKPNIYVGTCTCPDKHGFVSLSLGNTYEKRMIEAADLVILEMNPNMPYTYGDVELPVGDVDYFVEANYPAAQLPEVPFGEKDMVIGKLIADLVPDGSCLQLGIGAIPNAVSKALETKNDLGIHTELMTTGMMRLAKMGVVTGKRKQINRGKIVATFVLGTQELYDYVDHNPGVAILDGSWVNDPYTIAQNDNQISINSTMEIDLTGQCASEAIGTRHYSGTGGQTDTAVGAQMSKNGKSIITLYSTAMIKDPQTGERREASKIVPRLLPGATVSLSRNNVDRVVTEYGIAELRGASIRDRAERLIAVSHPKFREELREQAYELGILHRA